MDGNKIVLVVVGGDGRYEVQIGGFFALLLIVEIRPLGMIVIDDHCVRVVLGRKNNFES